MKTLFLSMGCTSRWLDSIGQRGFLVAAFTSAVFIPAIGCHNSNKPSPQVSSAATPISVPQARQSDPPATPSPAQAQTVMAEPIQVKAPASFTSEQLPQNLPAHFTVAASAGQFLRVKVNLGAGNDPRESVSVQPPGSDSAPLEAFQKGGDCWGNFVYALRETGIYHVEFDSAGRAASIDFSLLASDDPMIDPGISSGEISIDFGPFAQRDRIAAVPYAEGCDEGDESWPAHLGLDNGHFEFRIMQVAGYKKVFAKYSGGAGAMTNLEAALSPGGKVVASDKLVYTYKDEWGAYTMTARPDLLEGEGWRGLRWIAGYGGGDEDYPTNSLGYIFEGISNDGRYLILIRADISHPDQKRLHPRRPVHGPPGHAWESGDPKLETPARLRLEKALAVADPTSFQPSLNELDAVIRSLRLKK
jgi:hypothetical protein